MLELQAGGLASDSVPVADPATGTGTFVLGLLAEVQALTGALPRVEPRMYVTDTLGSPTPMAALFQASRPAIGLQRRAANRIRREQPITVVIGNPPYKDKAKGPGGWVEGDGRPRGAYASLDD